MYATPMRFACSSSVSSRLFFAGLAYLAAPAKPFSSTSCICIRFCSMLVDDEKMSPVSTSGPVWYGSSARTTRFMASTSMDSASTGVGTVMGCSTWAAAYIRFVASAYILTLLEILRRLMAEPQFPNTTDIDSRQTYFWEKIY